MRLLNGMIDRNQGLHQMDAMRLYSGVSQMGFCPSRTVMTASERFYKPLPIRPSTGE